MNDRPEDRRRGEEAGEWLVAGLVLVNLWCSTLCLGGYRPETMAVTVTLNVAALAGWPALEAWRGRGDAGQ